MPDNLLFGVILVTVILWLISLIKFRLGEDAEASRKILKIEIANMFYNMAVDVLLIGLAGLTIYCDVVNINDANILLALVFSIILAVIIVWKIISVSVKSQMFKQRWLWLKTNEDLELVEREQLTTKQRFYGYLPDIILFALSLIVLLT